MCGCPFLGLEDAVDLTSFGIFVDEAGAISDGPLSFVATNERSWEEEVRKREKGEFEFVENCWFSSAGKENVASR